MSRSAAALCLLGASVCLSACGSPDYQRTLPPARVAIELSQAPIYDDGETQMYESKAPLAFPILQPDQRSQRVLNDTDVPPYGARPWITTDDVGVQLSWSITNLDDETHNVHLLVDPWNEFGRYWPGLQLVDEDAGEYMPNLSGYDRFVEVVGTEVAGNSRIHGTVSFDAMRELATDFATVINIIENPPPVPAGEEDPSIRWANHAFDIHNHSEDDPLVRSYIPEVIAGLTGVDIGLRTYEPANISLEVVVEIVDRGAEKVVEEDSSDPTMEMPARQYTLGTAP